MVDERESQDPKRGKGLVYPIHTRLENNVGGGEAKCRNQKDEKHRSRRLRNPLFISVHRPDPFFALSEVVGYTYKLLLTININLYFAWPSLP